MNDQSPEEKAPPPSARPGERTDPPISPKTPPAAGSPGAAEGKSPERTARVSSKDIAPMLRGWQYEPGEINVRKINGIDGQPKLQMRLNLGLLQMEMTGRPDGGRPHGCESLLEYFEQQLEDYRSDHGGDEAGFALNADQCRSLREEAEMYYHRYLSLLVLEDFDGVVRDTARNLRVLDLCGKFASEEQDRLWLEQYRPYILMMNTRAQASVQMQAKRYGEALKTIDNGIAAIRAFYERFGQEHAVGSSNEVRVLRRLSRQIQGKLPVDPLHRLRRRLERAVKLERYEEAARLRDELASLQNRGDVSAETPGDGPGDGPGEAAGIEPV